MTRAAPRDRAGTARAALGALVSGIVFALTAPPTDAPLGLLAGLVGFALCMPPAEGEPRARRAVLVGLMFGLGANLVALRFVPEVITRFTPLGQAPATLALVLLSLAQAIPWLLGALSAHVLARRGVARWLAFACGVYVATFVPAIFPWTPAGGLATWPWMIQLADVVGEAVGDVGVQVDGVDAIGRPAGVGDVLLGHQHEGAVRHAAPVDVGFRCGHLLEGPAQVNGSGPTDRLVGPRDAALDRQVDLEGAGAIAVALIAVPQPGRLAAGGDAGEGMGSNIEQCHPVRGEITEGPHLAPGLDRPPERRHQAGKGVGYGPGSTFGHRPAVSVALSDEHHRRRGGQGLMKRTIDVGRHPREQGPGLGCSPASRHQRRRLQRRDTEPGHGQGMTGQVDHRAEDVVG